MIEVGPAAAAGRWRARRWSPVLACAACAPVDAPPIAPFGGELAAPLAARDVIGFCRFLAGDVRLAPLLAQLEGDGGHSGGPRRSLSIAGPAVTVLSLLDDASFVAADQPFAIVLLDAGVHGAIAGFAWRGDGEAFRAAARARGLVMPDADRVELPGRGRVEQFEVLSDMSLRGSTDHPVPHVDYHLVERDGVTLLLPARDGVRNVLAALERTRALDPGSGDFCFRIEFGPVVDEVRDVARRLATMPLDQLLANWSADPRLDGGPAGVEVRRYGMDANYWRLLGTAHDVVDALLDLGGSIEQLFVDVDDDRAELYLRAERDGFFRRLLPLARNLPLAELLAGTPADAEVVVAAACDPRLLDDVDTIWEASKQGFFRHGSRRRNRYFDDGNVGDQGPPFVDSFGGRVWFAFALEQPPAAGAGATDLMNRIAGKGFPAPPFTARVFAQLENDDVNVGLTAALAQDVLPSTWFESVQAASLALYSVSRVPGGCIEAIGARSNALVAAERRRLESAGAPPLPPDALPEAFLCAIGRIPGSDAPIVLTCARDGDGIRIRLTPPPR